MANRDIQGTVTDSGGNAISNAVVALFLQDNPNAVRTTQADSNGNFIFQGHPDGDGTLQTWHLTCRDPNDSSRQFRSLHTVSAELPDVLPEGTVTRGADGTGYGADYGRRGIEIAVGDSYGEFVSIQAKVSSETKGFTRAQIIRLSDENVITTKDVSGLSSGDIITFDTTLQQGTNYAVVLDAEGGNYTSATEDNPNLPYTGQNIDIDIVGGVYSGTNTDFDPANILGVGGFN